jgi:hypothetical protein
MEISICLSLHFTWTFRIPPTVAFRQRMILNLLHLHWQRDIAHRSYLTCIENWFIQNLFRNSVCCTVDSFLQNTKCCSESLPVLCHYGTLSAMLVGALPKPNVVLSLLKLIFISSSSLLHVVQTGSGAHWASYPMGTGGCFPGGKVCEVDHSLPSSTDVKKIWIYTSTPSYASMV